MSDAFRTLWINHRRLSGLSQQDVAEIMGCSKATVAAVEADCSRRIPSPGMVSAFCEICMLTDDEAAALHRAGARAIGWRI